MSERDSPPFSPSGPRSGSSADPEALAAVALIRVRGSDPDYLLLRRAANPQDPWSGHFALPGGRKDPEDRDLLETCIRETWEECGVKLQPGELIRALPLAIAGGHMGRPMGVAPFLFEVESRPELLLDQKEIAAAYWLAQSYLLDPANRVRAAMAASHPDREFPCIRVAGSEGAIWGFTYGVLEAFWESTPP